MYKEPAVLVLDEATSALNDAAERKILEEIRDMDGLTTILIVHRNAQRSEKMASKAKATERAIERRCGSEVCPGRGRRAP